MQLRWGCWSRTGACRYVYTTSVLDHGGVLAAATDWSRRTRRPYAVAALNLPGVYHACSTLDGPQRGKNAERLQLILIGFAHEIENA